LISGQSEIVDVGTKKIYSTLQKLKLQKSSTKEQIADKKANDSTQISGSVVSKSN
jgi:hypothetical protein